MNSIIGSLLTDIKNDEISFNWSANTSGVTRIIYQQSKGYKYYLCDFGAQSKIVDLQVPMYEELTELTFWLSG